MLNDHHELRQRLYAIDVDTAINIDELDSKINALMVRWVRHVGEEEDGQ